MKIFSIAFFLVWSFFSSFAQMPEGHQFGGQRPDSITLANMPKTGKIIGIVLDATTLKPVEYATVTVKSVRDSFVVSGAITNEKGKFTVSDLRPFGRYKLEVAFIGYGKVQTQPIQLNPQEPMADAGTIKISITSKTMKDVTIAAEKNDVVNTIDHKVYNVDKNIINTGGTATDVLQNIPSVTVDLDGNVSLRGSANVTVYIDGKPSGITGGNRQAVLQQIPANAIEEVEVITNPSAKYDAEGMAGIINIKTKKGKLKGLNGTISAGIGTNDKYNTGLNINNRNDYFNIYGSYSFRSESRDMTGHGFQTNFLPMRRYTVETNTKGSQQNYFHNGKIGADIYINTYNTLGSNVNFSTRHENHPELTSNITTSNITENTLVRDNTSIEQNDTWDGALDYKRTFKASKRELTASASYSSSHKTADNTYQSITNNVPASTFQDNKSDGKFTAGVFQSDYVQPFKQSKLETGLKATMRINDNDVHADSVLVPGYIYNNDSRYTDHFIYEEDIYAAYALFSSKFKSFDYNVGLRTEQTNTLGDSKTTTLNIKNDYLAFFPSASLKYKWKGSNELQLSYSRRTNRPQLQSLNPFTDYSDTLNIRKGNPYLLPEYIQSSELAYAKTLDNLSLSATIYYRHIDDVLSRFRSLDTISGVSSMSMVNFNTADNIGVESVVRYQIGKAGSIMWSFNIFQNTLNGKNVSADIEGSNTNWNTRITANYRFTKDLSAQLSGMYSAADRQPQRVMKSMMTGLDAGFKYDFLKGKASLSFNVTDIFNTRKFDIHIEQDFYVYDGIRKRESRVAMFTLSYRFGTQDTNTSQRKKSQRNAVQEGSGENNDSGGF